MFKNGNGIVTELIRESLRLSKKTVSFTQYNNIEAIKNFSQHRYDGVAVVASGMTDAYFSQPFVVFQNYAISLKDKNIDINDINDLKHYHVLAFSNARKLLGKEFSDTIQNAASYREMNMQADQIKALFNGKADVIIADYTIFTFHLRRLRNHFPLDKTYRQDIRFHDVFAPSEYHAAFHDKKLRDAFDYGFKQLNQSGQVDKIYQFYSNLLKHY